MARTSRTAKTSSKPGLMSRLRPRREEPAKVTQSRSTNPITGTHTTTTKAKTHPNGIGHRGHGGQGPLASDRGTTTTTHHQRRKPSMGDKVSGGLMKLKGSLTGKSGEKAAGTRRMHGTDGKGSHRRY